MENENLEVNNPEEENEEPLELTFLIPEDIITVKHNL